jgi:hypothetical protein
MQSPAISVYCTVATAARPWRGPAAATTGDAAAGASPRGVRVLAQAAGWPGRGLRGRGARWAGGMQAAVTRWNKGCARGQAGTQWGQAKWGMHPRTQDGSSHLSVRVEPLAVGRLMQCRQQVACVYAEPAEQRQQQQARGPAAQRRAMCGGQRDGVLGEQQACLQLGMPRRPPAALTPHLTILKS